MEDKEQQYTILKLVSGEEIVGLCDYHGHDGDYYHIYNPQIVKFSYDANGNYGLNLFPFIWGSETKLFTFKKKDVMLYAIPNKTLRDYYDSYTVEQNEEKEFADLPITPFTSDLVH